MLTGAGLALADDAGGLEAAHLRHLHVHQDHVEAVAGQALERFLAGADHRHVVAPLRQQAHGHALVHDVVLRQQHLAAQVRGQ